MRRVTELNTEPGEKLWLTHGIATEWVEDPQVDIWMTGKYSQAFVSVAQVDIIKEQANPGAAIGSLKIVHNASKLEALWNIDMAVIQFSILNAILFG